MHRLKCPNVSLDHDGSSLRDPLSAQRDDVADMELA